MLFCMQCDKRLTSDEVSIYRRLIYRDAEEYLCKACLAEKMRVTTNEIDRKIEHFKKIGCTLFS
ncbi:MAG: hypothetical protein IJV98_01495 [Clostridia bacterium]|nr:hypothetical protein [Clostridia bacterium]